MGGTEIGAKPWSFAVLFPFPMKRQNKIEFLTICFQFDIKVAEVVVSFLERNISTFTKGGEVMNAQLLMIKWMNFSV